jgi:hypothetical protein
MDYGAAVTRLFRHGPAGSPVTAAAVCTRLGYYPVLSPVYWYVGIFRLRKCPLTSFDLEHSGIGLDLTSTLISRYLFHCVFTKPCTTTVVL